jgi:hypothetical protein
MRSGLGLAGSTQYILAFRTWRKRFSFFAEVLGFFSKAFFKGSDLFEAASLHGTTSSLRVLTAGLEISPA